jgi:hypothetical protein
VLDELGLVEALRTLAETAPVPLVIDAAGLALRPPPAVERAVYGLARSMIADGHAAGASKVRVHLGERAGILTVDVRHDAPSVFDAIDAEDRVGAVGGTLSVDHGPTWTECVASFP